jgi:hypothetical protein
LPVFFLTTNTATQFFNRIACIDWLVRLLEIAFPESDRKGILFLLETPVHPPHLESRFVKNYQAIGSKASLFGLFLLLRKMRVRNKIAIRG